LEEVKKEEQTTIETLLALRTEERSAMIQRLTKKINDRTKKAFP
jgi:hypothetical protein